MLKTTVALTVSSVAFSAKLHSVTVDVEQQADHITHGKREDDVEHSLMTSSVLYQTAVTRCPRLGLVLHVTVKKN